jgi:hypothetical protein
MLAATADKTNFWWFIMSPFIITPRKLETIPIAVENIFP